MTCPYCGSIELDDVGIAYRCVTCGEISYEDEVGDYDEDDDEDEFYYNGEFGKPEDYPDWDGDESIMYEIERYRESKEKHDEYYWEEDDDETDED